MTRLLLIIISSLLLIVGLIYTLAFTSVGNNLLKPIIESKINESSPVKIKLEEFLLRTDKLKVLIQLDKDNTVLAQGTYSLFSQSFDIKYLVNLSKLDSLSEVAKRQLAGELLSDGEIKGNLDLFKIKGKSTLAKSDTHYALIIKDMQLNKAAVKLKDASVKVLLAMAGEKPYASGDIDLHVQLNDLDPNKMQGSVVFDLKEASLDAKLLHKEFGLKISRTALQANAKVKLVGNAVEYVLNVNSELASLLSQGKIKVADVNINTNYKIDIKELALLKSITNSPLRGPFSTQGTVSGDEKSLKVQGTSDLASSQTNYTVNLKEFKPSRIRAQIKNAELSKLLYLAGEPSYARGKLILNADITSLAPLNAKISTSVSKGIAHTKVIKKAFDLDLPYTSFEMTSNATIVEDKISAKTKLKSNLADLDMKKTVFDLKTASLLTDYLIFVPSLAKLEPVIKRKLKGQFKANGEVKKDKQLTITAHSNIFKGKLNAKIVDEKINADFKGLHTIEALKMLGYPQVMNAPIDGTFTYNTKAQQGKLDTTFENAVLSRSKMTSLIGSLTNADLTKERFSKGTLVSNINKDIIDSKVQMQNKKASITSKKFIVNSKKRLIDAKFALTVKKYTGDIIVKGDINKPNVMPDAKSMITPEIKEKAVQEINRFLKKLF